MGLGSPILQLSHVTRAAPPWEMISAEGACSDILRSSYTRYLADRKQGATRPLTPFLQRWVGITSNAVVLNVIREGHEIPFEKDPPPFNGVLNSSPKDPEEALVLRQELDDMLAKEAVTRLPDYLAREGYYSRYFLTIQCVSGQEYHNVLNH